MGERELRTAKPNPSIPGCSGHTHYSLWDRDGKTNLFADASDPQGMSPLMRHFIAGVLHCLPDVLPMYMPFVNRYMHPSETKRQTEGRPM
jgi:glutamine synthetase